MFKISDRKLRSLALIVAIASITATTLPVSSEFSTTGAQPASSTVTTSPPTPSSASTANTTTSSATVTANSSTSTTAATTSITTAKPETTSPSIEEAKKIIQQHIDPNLSENRLAVNKPQTSTAPMVDFGPDSIEARVSEATTRFGLNYINKLPADIKENVVLSPLSLQNLLNMVLLGTLDDSSSQQELNKVLGYESTNLVAASNASSDRLKPHEAMRNVFQSILQATHLSVSTPDPELLNTNTGSLNTETNSDPQREKATVSAHLQTSVKEGDTPLSGQVNFTLANLVLTDKSKLTLKPDYENELKTYYNVNVEYFSRNASNQNKSSEEQLPLHERVNNWVKNKTQNQIENLASEDDLSGDDLAMVLLNAAHFKGRWLHTFNPRATHEGTFFNGGQESGASKVKFMRQKAVFGYADFGTAALQNEFQGGDIKMRPSEDSETLLTEDDSGKTAPASASGDQQSLASPPIIEVSKEEARRMELTSRLNCSALMLPFSLNDGQELSMVILLPAKRDGLAELQAALTAQALNEVYRSISEQQVQVELPKFSFEASHDAKATLEKMGLSSIFLDSAKLTRMFDAQAKVDKVIHKAKINVDESGAEAAAASMVSIVLRNFIRPPSPVFVADHPFLFVVRHNRSNMPLFMGRVSNL